MAASPDLRELIDLRPYDLDPWDVQRRALEAVSTALDGFYEPLTADVEVVLIGGLAREVQDLVVAANRAVYSTTHGILNAFGVPWDPGSKALTTLTFVGVDGTAIPIGVEAQVTLSTGEPLLFATTAAGVIAGGTITLAAECVQRTSLANRIAIGTHVSLAVGVATVEDVTIASAVTGGIDPENVNDYYTRVANRLGRITDSLVLATHFNLAALEHPYVVRAQSVDNWDGVNISTIGDNINHVTVVTAGPDGTPLSAPQKAELTTELTARSMASLAVHVVDALIVPVAVVATVRALPGASPSDVEVSAMAALTAFLNPDTSEWGRTIQPNDFVELLGRDVSGADVVIGAITPSTPVVLSLNALPIFDAAGSTITVVTP